MLPLAATYRATSLSDDENAAPCHQARTYLTILRSSGHSSFVLLVLRVQEHGGGIPRTIGTLFYFSLALRGLLALPFFYHRAARLPLWM